MPLAGIRDTARPAPRQAAGRVEDEGARGETALDGARRLVEPALRGAIERLDPHTRQVCGYHLGFWDAERGAGVGGGKYVRPALALLSVRAAGAPAEQGVPAAAACELVHNFSLLHDDVMDGDAERRHQAAVWARFGTSTAILAGDAMLALANEVLSDASSPGVPRAVRCLNATVRRLVAGESADLSFENMAEVSLEDCVQAASAKTGALLACSASLGAVLVDAPVGLVTGLAGYGAHVGLAFQLVDDLLGIWGAPERTGKPAWSDLRARKKSLPVAAALTSRTEAGERLRRLYAEERRLDDAELAQAAALVEQAGGRSWARREAEREAAAALRILEDLALPRGVHDELSALTDLLSGREH
jgi:geranylgeranyl diphosphate synthase type I